METTKTMTHLQIHVHIRHTKVQTLRPTFLLLLLHRWLPLLWSRLRQRIEKTADAVAVLTVI